MAGNTSNTSQFDHSAATPGHQYDLHERHELESSEPAARTGFRKYVMQYTTSRLNCRLHVGSMAGPVAYYLHTRVAVRAPQLLLRRGDAKTAPVAAFCRLQTTSRHALVGRGDCEAQPERELVWEELRRDRNSLHRSDYQFGTSEGGGGRAGRAEFAWRKDRARLNRTVYDCVDEDGNVVARMLSGGAFNWRRGGDVEILEGLPQGLEEFLLITAIGIWAYEALSYQSLLQGFSDDAATKKKD